MTEEAKKKDENLAYSAEEALKHIEAKLAETDELKAMEEAARKEAIKKVLDAMKSALEGAYKEIPNKHEIGIAKTDLMNVATQVRTKQKDGKWEERISAFNKEIKIDTLMKGYAVAAIDELAAKKLEEAKKISEKLGDNDNFKETLADALKRELRPDADELDSKRSQNDLNKAKRKLEATEKYIKTVKEFADKVTPEMLAGMQTDATAITDKVVDLNKRRLAYQETVDAHKADNKKPEPDKATLEALDKEEKAIAESYAKTLADKYKDPKEKQAFNYVLQNQLSNAVDEKDLAKLSSSKVGKDILEMMGKTSFEKYAGVSASGKGTSNQAPTLGTGGRIAAGVGAAAAAAVAYKAFQSAGSDPTKVDEKTGEETPDPDRKQGMFAKVAKVAVGVVLTGALAVGLLAAARGGNPIKGFQEGQGVIGKFTSMVQSAGKFGQYRG